MHWMVVFILCGITVSAIGLPIMSNGVFITPIADSLGVYRGSVAMHNTMTLLLKAFMSLYVPTLMKKYSLKKILTTGALLAGTSNYLLGWVDTLVLFNILGITRGIGTGMLAWVPVTIIINEWFSEKHGLVTSLVLSFSSIGGAIFSPVFASLISTLGWEQSYRIMGILMVVFSLPAILVPFSLDPRENGYLPYGFVENNSAARNKKDNIIKPSQKNVSQFLFILLFLFTLLQTLLIGVPQHFPGFAQTLDLSPELGASMLSLAMISSIGFKLGLGYVSDKVGPVNSTIGTLAVIAISSAVLFFTEAVPLLYIGAFFFGAAYSIPSVSITLLTKEFFGRYNFTRLYPILAFSTSLGGAVSLSVVGFIYDFTGSYLSAFVIAFGINVFNIFVILFIARRNKASAK